MTETGKASDQLLTEEAYARSIGKAGKVYPPVQLPSMEIWMYHRQRADRRYPNIPWDVVAQWKQEYLDNVEVYVSQHRRYMEWMEGYLQWTKKQLKLIHAGNNGTQLGAREFTFTYGTHFEDDSEAQRVMKQAIDRLTRYYKDEIIEFHAVGEYTRAGRSHVHGWYHLEGGKKITDKNFKRAYPPWNPKKKLGKGFEGGHHATIERVSDFHGYTEKHLEEAWLNVNITNDADDSPRAQTPSRLLEVVDVPVFQGSEDAPGGEVSGSPCSQSSSDDCKASDAEEY